jgi:hypothetical protein
MSKNERYSTMPEIWHICDSSWQNPRAVASGTLLEKFIQAQWLTLHPLITFCQNEFLLGAKVAESNTITSKRKMCKKPGILPCLPCSIDQPVASTLSLSQHHDISTDPQKFVFSNN